MCKGTVGQTDKSNDNERDRQIEVAIQELLEQGSYANRSPRISVGNLTISESTSLTANQTRAASLVPAPESPVA